jgi:hypothetical protein
LPLLVRTGALRPGENAALTMADLQTQRDGDLIRIQAAQDRLAAGPFHPTSDGTCRAQGHSPLRLRAITANAASDIVHERAAAGLDATRITGHATTAALAGVVLHRIAAQTRHRQIAMLLDRYVRPAQGLHITSSRDLGL